MNWNRPEARKFLFAHLDFFSKSGDRLAARNAAIRVADAAGIAGAVIADCLALDSGVVYRVIHREYDSACNLKRAQSAERQAAGWLAKAQKALTRAEQNFRVAQGRRKALEVRLRESGVAIPDKIADLATHAPRKRAKRPSRPDTTTRKPPARLLLRFVREIRQPEEETQFKPYYSGLRGF